MFELKPAVKAKVTNVEVLSHKNREVDADPGVKLSFSCKVPNSVVALLNARILPALWERQGETAPPPQGSLEGVAPVSDLPNLTPMGAHVPTLPWDEELTGYTLLMDYGTGGRSNEEIKDCKLHTFRVQPHEGGTATLKFKCESVNVAEKLWGRLAKKKGREFEIILTPPAIVQSDIEDDSGPEPVKAAEPREPGAAERAAAAKAGKAPAEPPAPHKGNERPARTERGKAQTAAALAAGQAEHEAAQRKAAEQAAAATQAFATGTGATT